MTRSQRLTLLACILGSSTAFLDGTLVNVALPSIRADLHGGLATQQWIVDAYLLTLGSLLLVGGSLGDILGRRRVFAVGVGGFGVASLLCAAAPNAGLLIAARALQGIAGGALVPSTLALLMDTFSDHQRAAAIGAWTAWTGIATAAGPLAAGLLIELGSWRWIFVVNLPLVVVTLRLLAHAPPGVRATGGRVDWTGALLCVLGLGGSVFALIEQPRYGWSDPRVWPALVAGVGLLAVFLVWERRSRSPMLPLAMFRVRNFAIGNLTTLLLYASLNTLSFFLVVFLQQVAGYSPLHAGLALLPMSIITFLLARRFGALADRVGPRLFMGIGPIVAGAGVLLLAFAGARANYFEMLLPGITLFSLGLAATVAPLTAAVLGAVGGGHSGVASGINNAIARIAGLVAIAAVGAVVAAHFAAGVQSRLDHGRTALSAAPLRQVRERPFVIDASAFAAAERPAVRAALVSSSLDSYRLAMEISAALAILSGLISLCGISNRRRAIAGADDAGGALARAGAASEPGRPPAPSVAGI
jgi:EmrB/QacA subfamily drug resistance transporter